MSSTTGGKMCLFSNISGVITLEGKPVVGAKIKRVVGKAHTHGKKTDEAETDAQGRFDMPAIFDYTLVGKVLPMEFSVPQEIFVYYEGNEYDIWSGVKRRPEENAEARGKPLVVECQLDGERRRVAVNGGSIYTLCEWDVEEDEPFVIDLPIPDQED